MKLEIPKFGNLIYTIHRKSYVIQIDGTDHSIYRKKVIKKTREIKLSAEINYS